MNRVGIRDLRKDLSAHIKSASAGESILVTVDGEPKAKLVPIEPTRSERTLDDLIASGRIIPAKRRGEPVPEPPPMVEGGRPSSEILDEIRADRF